MNPLPLVAVAGNPNAGKSALFNALTGARQKVGNYPGVTVERHVGKALLPDGSPVEAIATRIGPFSATTGDRYLNYMPSQEKFAIMARQLATMITAGLSLLRSLAILAGNAQKLYVMVLNRTQDTDHTVLLRQANITGFNFNEAAAIRTAAEIQKAGGIRWIATRSTTMARGPAFSRRGA